MPKLCRLLERAQIDGVLCEAGHEFTLPDGVRGPHKSVMKSCDLHAASLDAASDKAFTGRSGPQWEDVPLYEEIREKRPELEAVHDMVEKLNEADLSA